MDGVGILMPCSNFHKPFLSHGFARNFRASMTCEKSRLPGRPVPALFCVGRENIRSCGLRMLGKNLKMSTPTQVQTMRASCIPSHVSSTGVAWDCHEKLPVDPETARVAIF